MTEEAKPAENVLTLAQKILDIQKNVPMVKKKGFNKEHNYKFLQIEDAVLAVNKMLSVRDLILTQDMAKRIDGSDHWETVPHATKGYIAKVMLCWTLEDVVTRESRTYRIPGEGYDTTDKGTPKAITASRKQAIITIFNLPVGDNPEANSPWIDGKERQNEVLKQKMNAAAAAAGVAPVEKFLFYKWFDESQTAEITGDIDLKKANQDLLKPLKLGGKLVATADQLEELKLTLEERGVPFKCLR